jgi:hypothetical protein
MDHNEVANLLLIQREAAEHGDLLYELKEAALKRLVEINKSLPKSARRQQPAA